MAALLLLVLAEAACGLRGDDAVRSLGFDREGELGGRNDEGPVDSASEDEGGEGFVWPVIVVVEDDEQW